MMWEIFLDWKNNMKQLKIFLRIKKKIIINQWEYSLVPNSQPPPTNFYSIPSQPHTDIHKHTNTHTHPGIKSLEKFHPRRKDKRVVCINKYFFANFTQSNFFLFLFLLVKVTSYILSSQKSQYIPFFFSFSFSFSSWFTLKHTCRFQKNSFWGVYRTLYSKP